MESVRLRNAPSCLKEKGGNRENATANIPRRLDQSNTTVLLP